MHELKKWEQNKVTIGQCACHLMSQNQADWLWLIKSLTLYQAGLWYSTKWPDMVSWCVECWMACLSYIPLHVHLFGSNQQLLVDLTTILDYMLTNNWTMNMGMHGVSEKIWNVPCHFLRKTHSSKCPIKGTPWPIWHWPHQSEAPHDLSDTKPTNHRHLALNSPITGTPWPIWH